MINWNVPPEIVSFGPIEVRWYGILFATSFFLGFLIIGWIFKIEKKSAKDLDELFFFMIVGTVIGARLGHTIFYDPIYYFSNPIRILKIWEGGLASHGAAIGIFAALFYYSRKKSDQRYLWLLDRMAIIIPLSGFFIRIGNLFNSEIIGKPTAVPWAFIFSRIDNLPRHPTQLYESIGYLLIFIALFKIYRINQEKTTPGIILGTFLISAFSFRFLIEFLKESQSDFEKGMIINMGQILSLPLILLGLIIIIRLKANKKTSSIKN